MLDRPWARLIVSVALVLLVAPSSAHLAGLAVPGASAPSAATPNLATASSSAQPFSPAALAPAATALDLMPLPGVVDLNTLRHGRMLVSHALTPIPLDTGYRNAAAAPAQLQFSCPPTTNQDYLQQFVDPSDPDRTVYGCPFRVYDSDYHFGNPQLAIDPDDPSGMAFVALHGNPAPNGPTPRSRNDLTHTAFTTGNQGLSWTDQPTSYGGGGNGLAFLGESASIATDSRGNNYILYLWSLPNGNETTGYQGLIGLYKAGHSSEQNSASSSYTSGHYVRSRSPTNIIANAYVLNIPPRIPPPPFANYTLTANGTVPPPANETQIGQEANPVNRSEERVAAVWFEKAVDYRNSTTGYAGWIDATIGTVNDKNDWKRLDARLNSSQLIGPCMDASNPVAWDGRIYVACVVDNGYSHRSRARIGDIDIWALDPLTGNTTYVSTTGLRGGHPILAATPDGYFAIVSTLKQGATQPARIQGSFGYYGTQWEATGSDMGPELHRLLGNHDTFDLNVNALAITPTEKTVAIVYMEWQSNRTAETTDPNQPPPVVDPTNPVPPSPQLTDFQKLVVSFNQCTFPGAIAASVMQLGTGVDPQNLEAYTIQPSLFDDTQDGLVAHKNAIGEDVLTFAVNDYGAMQVGSILAAPASTACQLPIPPANVPPPPLATALGLPNAAITAVGSVLGLAAISMVTYLLTVKRRVAHFAVAEAK
ncbi:MAG: hypothetical protein AABX89_00585 [Candidatus Thermoplasmatota archaeon]